MTTAHRLMSRVREWSYRGKTWPQSRQAARRERNGTRGGRMHLVNARIAADTVAGRCEEKASLMSITAATIAEAAPPGRRCCRGPACSGVSPQPLTGGLRACFPLTAGT